jgi:hopanoid biosynthesis associated protein HpnK
VTTSAIINADDFGLSPGVNRGVVDAFREGVLTSTTAMVNVDSFEEAARLARENPDLPVGVHLNLLWGEPVSNPAEVPTLVDRGAFLRKSSALASRYFFGRLSPDHVKLEFRNQIRTFVDAGLTPTHVDTHKHVHCLPGILDALTSAAREFRIDKIRVPSEKPSAATRRSGKAAGKRRLIRFLCRGARTRLRAAGMRTTDHFAGIEHTGRLNSDALNLILSNLRSGVTEIMCHPGYADESTDKYSSTRLQREVELASLKDPRVKERIASEAIRLIHYGDL